jgi:predicted membrane-bound spermidine synthase
VLAYEILLMRLLSIGYWHHFAYMVISMALFGFGASGAFLFLVFRRIKARLDEWLVILAGTAGVSFPLSFHISQQIGLDPLQLVWQPGQWLRMLLTYVALAVPFLLAGGIVGIILTGAGKRMHRMYGVDLIGAAFGALCIVPALYLGPPWVLLPALGGTVILGAIGCCRRWQHPSLGAAILLMAAGAVAVVYIIAPPVPAIHHTKALPVTLSFPDARIEARRAGPLGVIHVVGSALIRHVPGLSLNFGLGTGDDSADLPKQKALFVDAEGLSPITRFSGDLAELDHLDYTTMALPYHVRPPASVLVVGAGGGSDVLLALRHRPVHITALEANKQVAELLQGPFASFSGKLYRRADVRLEVREARQFLHATNKAFDLIQLSLLDSYAAAAGGVHSAAESYLYTTDALWLYLSRLTDSGIVAITRWLKLPPRDSFRTFATALTALRDARLSEHPERHLLFIRSWKTATILIAKSPFTEKEIRLATAFCDRRSFDLAYYAGMSEGRANRYDLQEIPYYFRGATALCGRDADSFLKDYVFDVSPTTDNRPYFSHFFRWDKAWTLCKHLRREWLPSIELGYVFILATLLQAALAAGLVIISPLLLQRHLNRTARETEEPPGRSTFLGTLIYFGCIGVGFMLLEVVLLARYTLLLSQPVYSAAVVLSAVLVFAGLGSLLVQRHRAMQPAFLWIALGAICLWVGLHAVFGGPLFEHAFEWALWQRVLLAGILLGALSFFLGWPFPAGLHVVAARFPILVPWAWGINGCASVVGAILAKGLAVSLGFRLVMICACVLYAIAVAAFYLFLRGRPRLSS